MSIAADVQSGGSADGCSAQPGGPIAGDAEADACGIAGVVDADPHAGDGEMRAGSEAEPAEADQSGIERPPEGDSVTSGPPSADTGVAGHPTHVDPSVLPKLQGQRLASLVSLVDERKISDRELLDLVFNTVCETGEIFAASYGMLVWLINLAQLTASYPQLDFSIGIFRHPILVFHSCSVLAKLC